MSTLTEPDFLRIFNRLCVALREPQDDSGTTQVVYWQALSDLALEGLRGGAEALTKETGRRFFPTTAEWRTAAHHWEAKQGTGRLSVTGRVWREECWQCGDTGWMRNLRCDGDAACGRTKAHLPHDYTIPCACRPTNSTYRRHHL